MKSVSSPLKEILVFTLAILSVLASAGDKTGNGGFAYKNSKVLLENAKKSILHELPGEDDSIWNGSRTNYLRFRLSIENLESLPEAPSRYRSGELLMFDYDSNGESPKVQVLKPYFDAFAAMGPETAPVFELEVRRRITHEASHVIGLDEEKSAEFSENILKTIRHRSVSAPSAVAHSSKCKTRFKIMDAKNFSVTIGYDRPYSKRFWAGLDFDASVSKVTYKFFSDKAFMGANEYSSVSEARQDTSNLSFLLFAAKFNKTPLVACLSNEGRIYLEVPAEGVRVEMPANALEIAASKDIDGLSALLNTPSDERAIKGVVVTFWHSPSHEPITGFEFKSLDIAKKVANVISFKAAAANESGIIALTLDPAGNFDIEPVMK